jgi:hypothetical protein
MDFIEFSAPNPSRCQEVPCRFALRGPCEFGHHPAFTGKFSEFVRWVHLVILPKGQISFFIQRAPSSGGRLHGDDCTDYDGGPDVATVAQFQD